MIWFGFLLSVIVILFLSRKDLALGLFSGAVLLGIFTLSIGQMAVQFYETFSDPSVILLAGVVFFIPMIGGFLEESGHMEGLVKNMRIGQKPFLALSPALLGMLPMPGGALLSAPLVEKGGGNTSGRIKASVNVWFRHVLYLIYPLGPTLIASAKIANLEVYEVIPFLFPTLIFSLLLGYFFYLRNISGGIEYQGEFSLTRLLIPLGVILTAPVLDFMLKTTFQLGIPEISPLIGVSLSMVLGFALTNFSWDILNKVFWEMAPWKFALIIFGMFTFLNIFRVSGAPELMANLPLPSYVLYILGGYLLGLITGRIQAPASILFPIYLIKYGEMSPIVFALSFFSIFLGYCASPIHPCVSVSVEYFGITIRDFLRSLVPPTIIALILCLIVAIFTF